MIDPAQLGLSVDTKNKMKHLTLLLSLALAGSGFAEKVTANDLFRKGEAALAKGDIASAKTAYAQALQLDPSHGDSKFRLLSMKDLNASARVKVRQDKLASVKLEQVTFEDLTLEESLEALGAMVGKATNNTFDPNFVIEDPERKLASNSVNIKLRNIPASVALKYILSQAKAQDSWDEHVITVRPLANSSTSKAATVVAE